MEQRVAKLAEISVGSLKRVTVDGRAICLARPEDGRVYAIDDACTHEGYSLSEGELFDFDVECPMHGSRFDLRTGRPTCLPAEIPSCIYAVRIDNDEIYLSGVPSVPPA